MDRAQAQFLKQLGNDHTPRIARPPLQCLVQKIHFLGREVTLLRIGAKHLATLHIPGCLYALQLQRKCRIEVS
ncbi:hypothetical protein A7X64_08045 [Stenotrophomonas maltophilia]|nr:hypothetical protein A7X64_08045 [Stenotrophomonas maltophilia]